MLVLIQGEDGPDAQRLRADHLAAHLAFVAAEMASIRVAGPIPGPAPGSFRGSLYIIEAADEAEARAFIARDPYGRAGVWARIEVKPFRAVAGTWVGGKAWADPLK